MSLTTIPSTPKDTYLPARSFDGPGQDPSIRFPLHLGDLGHSSYLLMAYALASLTRLSATR
jgi:hypothetical protein